MEFKPHLDHLLTDFEGGNKSFEDIAVAVVWDVGDAEAFEAASQFRLDRIESTDPQKQFYGETHALSTAGIAKKVHVILLKDVIETLITNV